MLLSKEVEGEMNLQFECQVAVYALASALWG